MINMSQFIYAISVTIGLAVVGLIAPPSFGMSAADIAKIAKGATVTIDSESSHGSGVIIQQQGNQYLVLTAAHVVKSKRLKYEVVTADDLHYQLQPTTIQPIAGVDLAVVKFTSNKVYQVPKLGNANNSTEGTTIYVAGFPVGTEAIDRLVFNFTDGKVTANSSKPLKDGYSIIYSNNTLPGMSGGGVFNDNGELIAIHGKGDVDTKIKTSEVDPNIRIKTGFNLGIPINTFQQLASRIGINAGDGSTIANKSQPKADDFVLLGFDRVSKNDLAGSVVEFSKAVELNPKLVTARFWRGTCKLLMGDTQGAIADLNGAIALNPKKLEAYIYRGAAYAKLGDRTKAIADLDKAVNIFPQSNLAYGNRCSLKLKLGDFNGAIADCNQAIQLKPKVATVLIDRGIAKSQLGDKKGSIVDLQAAAKLYLDRKDQQNYQLVLNKIAELQRG
jgi:Tfp pilus assembly protein PilF/V8-like Glu-specific endopeptidase